MKKLFTIIRNSADYALWGIPSVLAPFVLLVVFSQNSLPGGIFYPYKRGVEIIVLGIASLNPAAKAYLYANFADRRFDEAEKMLLANANTEALPTFVSQVQDAQLAIARVSDSAQKKELSDALVKKIDTYQQKLQQIQIQIDSGTLSEEPQNAQPISPGQGLEPTLEEQEPFLSVTSTLRRPSPTRPVATPTLTQHPTITPPSGGSGGNGGEIGSTISDLDKIRDLLKKAGQDDLPGGSSSTTPTPTSTPTPTLTPTRMPTPTVIPSPTQQISPSSASTDEGKKKKKKKEKHEED